MRRLITTLGPVAGDELGMILPHEHIFVQLDSLEEAHYLAAEPGPVIDLMAPELERAKSVGVTALVECTALGVGRRADIVRAVSEAAGVPVVVPTGIYREPWVPRWAQEASTGELRDWMLDELTDQIEESGVQAGRATDALIGSHTIRGRVVLDQLDILEEEGFALDRFVWIHTQIEPDLDLHLEIARRGPWIEYDAVGSEEDDFYVERILRVLEAGLDHRLLLSHDRGWYDPSLPGGGVPRPYTYLSDLFLPRLRAEGLDEATIRQLTWTNPFRAFAR